MDFYLARLPQFKDLPPRLLEELAPRFVLRRHRRREVLFDEGDPAGSVFLLKSGLVKAVKYSPRTEPFIMDIIVPGSFFGMVAVMDKKPYPVSAIAIQDSEVYHVSAPVFEELLRRHPPFSQEIYRLMGAHLRHSQEMRSLVKEPAEKRIVHILHMLGLRLGRELRVRREDIAEMAGTTPETAIRVLVGLRKRKLITTGWKRIVLLDSEALKALAE